MTIVDSIKFYEVSSDVPARIKGRLDASDKPYFVLIDSIEQFADEAKGTIVGVTVCLKVGNKIAFNDSYTGKASLHFTNQVKFNETKLVDYIDVSDRIYLDQRIVDILGQTLQSIVSNIRVLEKTSQDSINTIYKNKTTEN